jgi:hypothetical protein
VGLRISNNARTNEAMLMVRSIPMVLFLELDETNTHNYFKSKKNKQYIDHKKRKKGQATIYKTLQRKLRFDKHEPTQNRG